MSSRAPNLSFRAKPRNPSRSYTIPAIRRNPTHPSVIPSPLNVIPSEAEESKPFIHNPRLPEHTRLSPQPDHTPVIPGNDRNPPIPSFRRRPEPRGAGTRQYRHHIPSSTASHRNPTTPPSSPAMTGTHPYRLSGVGRNPGARGTRQYRRHIPSSTATHRNPTTPPSSPAMTGTHPYRLSGVGRNPGARGHVNTGVTSLPARPLAATRPHPRLPRQ